MKKLFILCILILLAAACGRGEESVTLTPDGLVQRTLTIRGNDNFRFVVEQARNMLNESWQERGYYLTINFERFEVIEWDGGDFEAWHSSNELRMGRLRTELMSGMGPDLVFNENFPLYQFAQSALLVDFYTLMDNCNRTSRDDFFVNVLKANEFRGGLYELPMMFGFHYIGINNNIPDSILYRFTQYSYIRASDLIELYFDFLDNYNEFLQIGLWTTLFNPANSNIMNYIDLDTNTVNLNGSGFIESHLLFNRLEFGLHSNWQQIVMPIASADHVRTLGGTNMFRSCNVNFNPADAFIDRNIPFGSFLPLANDYGALVVNLRENLVSGNNMNTMLPNIWMPSTRNTALAWEFTYYLIAAFSEPYDLAAVIPGWGMVAQWGRTTFNVPIMRSLFESNIHATFEHLDYFLYSRHGFEIEDIDTAVQNAIERINKYANMPMVLSRPHLPMNLIYSPLFDFLRGLITEQEAITRAENAMTLWLME